MPRYLRGEVVLVPFPFSGSEGYKPRPAIVLASWSYKNSRDYLLCMVSTQTDTDPYLITLDTSDLTLDTSDLAEGRLSQTCYIRPTYNFSADEGFIKHKIGKLKPEKLQAILHTLITVLTHEDQ